MSHHGNTSVSFVQRSSQRKRRGPRGVATLWIVLWLPVLVILLCVVVEIGNIWLARVELENAVEAAALATVQEWKTTSSTTLGRMRGQTIGAANCVRGTAVALDLNEGAGANGNASCGPDGEIVLGSVEIGGPVIFSADAAPGNVPVGTTVSLKVRVQTQTDTLADVNPASNCPFRIFDFSSSDSDLRISFVSFRITPPIANPNDNNPPDTSYFDYRQQGGGQGDDRKNGAPPIPNNSTACPSSIASGVTGHAFSGLFPGGTSQAFTVTFTGTGNDAFEPDMMPTGDAFDFGVDTDFAGLNPLTGENEAADRGGDFHGGLVTVGLKLASTGKFVGTITGTLQLIDCDTDAPLTPLDPNNFASRQDLENDYNTTNDGHHCSQLVFTNVGLQSGIFGVRVTKKQTVNSVCTNLFGLPTVPFEVSARSFAISQGSAMPRLIRVDQYVCDGVARDPCD